jgi:hypothetical protein
MSGDKHKFTGKKLIQKGFYIDQPMYTDGTLYQPGDPIVSDDYKLNIFETTVERAFFYCPELC